MSVNTNPYFIGLMMLLLNMGGRFLPMEITKEQEKVLQNPWFRRSLFFVVLFVATRNVFVALIGTIVILLFVNYLFNENSSLCLFKACGLRADATAESQPVASAPAPGQPGGLTPEEAEIYKRLHDKQARLAAAATAVTAQVNAPKEAEKEDTGIPMEDVYAYNLYRLRA